MKDSHVHTIDFAAYVKDLADTSEPGHEAEALLLSCMDFRFFGVIAEYMDCAGLKGKYDHVILAGAALGAVVPAKPAWHETFDDHVGLAIQLHNIRRVIVLEHQDCGAYSKKGFGVLLPPFTEEEERAAHFEQVETLRPRIPKSLLYEAFFLKVPPEEKAMTFDKLI